MSKPRLLCSFSGGKTSAFMTKWCLDNLGDVYDIKTVFANTGEENEKTLTFVNNCDLVFGFNTAWVEAVPMEGRISTKHDLVDFKSASRNGEPFERIISKYGIPNTVFPHCTRELKLNPITSFLVSQGWEKGSYATAIGIRIDEKRRVSKEADVRSIIYPLIDLIPMDKQDIETAIHLWPFKLELMEHQGNCKTCWKKSFKKLYKIAQETPEYFDFNKRMEEKYGRTGAGSLAGDSRVFFRMATPTSKLILAAMECVTPPTIPLEDGGCSESCEIYDTESGTNV